MSECQLHLIDDSTGQAIFETNGKWIHLSFDTGCVPRELPDKIAALRCTLNGLYVAKEKTFSKQESLVFYVRNRWQELLDVPDVPISEVIHFFPEQLQRAWQTFAAIKKSKTQYRERLDENTLRRPVKKRKIGCPLTEVPYLALRNPFSTDFQLAGEVNWGKDLRNAIHILQKTTQSVDCEELAFVAVVKLWNRLDRNKNDDSRLWLGKLRIFCNRVARESLELKATRAKHEASFVGHGCHKIETKQDATDPVRFAIKQEQARIVWEALEDLGPPLRIISEKYFLEGKKVPEVAMELSLNRSVVSKQLAIAERLLKNKLCNVR